jgi:hypothetical protein
VASGTLPAGLTLSSSGVISGTLLNANSPQNFPVNIQVTDALNRSIYVTFILVVQAPISVTTNAPGSFQFDTGSTYVQPPSGNNSMTFLVSGEMPPYTWTAAGLPPGLNIDRSSGVIVGTPTQAGTFSATITATDSQGRSGSLRLNLPVVTTPLVITTSTLPSGTVGVAYNQFLDAQGGSQSGYTWSVAGNLPAGLTAHSPAGCSSICGYQISGTPIQAGSFILTVSVTDSIQTKAQQIFTLVINSGTPPKITTSTLSLATIGQAYSFPFQATGGTPPYHWSLMGPSPDSNLQLSSAGVIAGAAAVPNDCVTGPDYWAQSGSITFQVQVTDAASQSTIGRFCLPAYYPTPTVIGFAPPSLVVDGQIHTVTMNGSNFRSSDVIYGGSGVKLATTFVSGSALSFVLTPQVGSAYSGIAEGAFPFWVVQPYSYPSNEDRTFTVYDPVPTITSVQAVLNNSASPCYPNVLCQLVVNGTGLVYSTQYEVMQVNQSVVVAQSPSTPIPWETITTSSFPFPAAGAYTLKVTNGNQPSGTVSVTKQFVVQ